MKEIKEKVAKYKFDASKNILLHKEIRNLLEGKYKKTLETVKRINEIIQELENNLELIEIEEIKKEKETNEEAQKYFGDNFINEFNNIKSNILNNNCSFFIHGTFIDRCDSILRNGLIYSSKDILATAIPFREELNYTDLLNWPHREHKGLVILGISNDCFGAKENLKPLWKYDKENSNEYQKKYLINKEFIYGYIDVVKKEIIKNPDFSYNPDYNNLEYDISSKKIDSSKIKEEYNPTISNNIEIKYNYDFTDIKDELLYYVAQFTFNNLLDKDIVSETLLKIKENQQKLNEIILNENISMKDIDIKEEQANNYLLNTQEYINEWDFPPIEDSTKGK